MGGSVDNRADKFIGEIEQPPDWEQQQQRDAQERERQREREEQRPAQVAERAAHEAFYISHLAETKKDLVLLLLQRPDGSTLSELMSATGWQAHSVRGFTGGTVKKQLGFVVQTLINKLGERAYSTATVC